MVIQNVSTTLNIYTDVYEERQIEVTEMLGNVPKSGQLGQKVVTRKTRWSKPTWYKRYKCIYSVS
ncbi:hypothetical protein ACT7C5_28860, partial [Bacillus pacificus]